MICCYKNIVEERSGVGGEVSTVDMGSGKSLPACGTETAKAERWKHTWRAQMVWLEWRRWGRSPKKCGWGGNVDVVGL